MTKTSTLALTTCKWTLRADLAQITALDGWIERVLADWQADPRTVFTARLCVTEIVTNTIEHGGPGSDSEITVTLRRATDAVDIEIVDSAPPFDPTERALPPLPTSIETVAPRGWGVRLLRAYAKDITYRSDDGHNRLSMRIATGGA